MSRLVVQERSGVERSGEEGEHEGEHRGQQRNCRACGTNRRAQRGRAPAPPETGVDPHSTYCRLTESQQAFEDEMNTHERDDDINAAGIEQAWSALPEAVRETLRRRNT